MRCYEVPTEEQMANTLESYTRRFRWMRKSSIILLRAKFGVNVKLATGCPVMGLRFSDWNHLLTARRSYVCPS